MKYKQPGDQLQNGRYTYTIEKMLGRGGFGVTYKAIKQIGNNYRQLVAIKTLNPNIQALPEKEYFKHQENFLKEAFKLKGFNHRHIVKVNDIFQEGNFWYMDMEYIQGQHLGEYLEYYHSKYNQKLSELEALSYIKQIGEALIHVHKNGILHRDVKPDNIMLWENSKRAVLIDFGIAREFVQNETRTHTNVKTEGFAPIEQYHIQSKRGAYTDIYALAATLYHMLTMMKVIPAEYREQGISLQPPKHFNPEISDHVNDAIMKGMELYPENRPQTMAEWLELLFPPKRQIPLKTFSFQIFTVNNKGEIINCQNKEAQYINDVLGVDSLGNEINLELVYIPSGRFMMGTPGIDRESPQHWVDLSAFFMSKYPITQIQWELIMGNNPSRFKGPNRPVECVSWEDCVSFCEKVSKIIGKECTLPSEAQWEYACRAGTTTAHFLAETVAVGITSDGDYIYQNQPKGICRGATTEVGIFPANGFGLYDMYGNVWEWCADSWHYSYEGAPSDGKAWIDNGYTFKQQVVRGASMRCDTKTCRSADREGRRRNKGYEFLGFRMAWVP